MTLPTYRWRLAHLTALWAFGVAQPVFSMLQSNPEFLVVRGSTRGDVVVFALVLSVVPPLLVVGLEAVAGVVSTMVSRALHIVAIWGFSFLAALQLVRQLGPERAIALVVPMIPAALAALAYMKWRPFRSFLSIALVLPAVGLVAFVSGVPLAVDDRPGVAVDVRSRTPVVLVVFDEFPVSSLMRADGSLDTVRYPGFAALARDAVWYPRATATHVSTSQAVPSILTGRLPADGELPTLDDHPDNLFTLLGESYAVESFEQATRLCPSRYCPRTRRPVPVLDRQRGLLYDVSIGYLHGALPRSLREGLPPIGQRWGGFGDGEDVDPRELVLGALDENAWHGALRHVRGRKRVQYQEFLQSIRPGTPGRRLYFEHTVLPHSPWGFLPSGREYRNTATVEGIDVDWIRWDRSPFLVEHALQRHKLQVGYADLLVRQLLERLRASGLYERALVVVTADHGVSFQPGGYMRDVSEENLADIAGVPLFVKYPGGQEGRIDTRHAQTTDVLPTIADVVRARLPWKVDGTSLVGRPVFRPVAVGSFRHDTTVVGSVREVRQGVLATARRNASLFGEGHDSLYRIGPHPELLGRRASTLVSGRAADVEVHLADRAQFDAVRLTSPFVPSRIVGDIEGRAPTTGSPLAVAVNGRVAATATAFEADGRTRFVALVPESVFRNGRNAVQVYRVTAGGRNARLELLGGTPNVRHLASGRSRRPSTTE